MTRIWSSTLRPHPLQLVEFVLSGCQSPPRLWLVTNYACYSQWQNIKLQPRRRQCPDWWLQQCKNLSAIKWRAQCCDFCFDFLSRSLGFFQGCSLPFIYSAMFNFVAHATMTTQFRLQIIHTASIYCNSKHHLLNDSSCCVWVISTQNVKKNSWADITHRQILQIAVKIQICAELKYQFRLQSVLAIKCLPVKGSLRETIHPGL